MSGPRDALALPLDGIRVVEASAGTGKTFTIATLYLRLILERGLEPAAIVVATFTRAATAELSDRLRRRVVIADTLLAGDAPATASEGDDGETLETRKVIAQALDLGVSHEVLRQRARDARLTADTAAIGTLHGFCHRVLAEFGFETGQALRQPELVEDIRELEAEIVRDFWRRGSADADTAELLAATWQSPETLVRKVRDSRWRGRTTELVEPDTATASAAFARARAAIDAWPPAVIDEFGQELTRCVKTASTRGSRTAALQDLRAWARDDANDDTAASFDAKAARSLTADAIETLQPKGERPAGQVFDDIDALLAAFDAWQDAQLAAAKVPAARLLLEARAHLERELPRRLAALNQMGHDQAVDRLAAALADPVRGAGAIARIRTRWRAALVDEFQDTDARQWQVVRALFGDTSLVLVGDPKQAIYGFRGGDVFAWLDACRHAEGEPLRLAESWRAGAGMADATNALFSRPDAFIEAGIGHPPVRSAAPVSRRALLRGGSVEPALQVWWLDPEEIGHANGRPPSKARATAAIQRACVAWIAGLLQDPGARLRDGSGRLEPLRPKHVAVLVNDNREAHAMQAALGHAGVPASSNLRASVYASDEADDLALLLDALAARDDLRRARAARASVLVGDDAATIASSTRDDAVGAAMLEGIAVWAEAVSRHGPLAWLHALVAAAAPRLLALPDGERRVANYLQLAELLQALHARSFGLDDLATRFARARVEAADDADAARLRLDTDADAVTVSTVHAAKGLEYDVVLVPYAVLGRNPDPSGENVPLYWYHAGNDARVAVGSGAAGAVREQAITEVRAEDMRRFYVAVTRAAALCVVPWGAVSSAVYSPLFHLLHHAGRDPDDWLDCDEDGCRRALEALYARGNDCVRVHALPDASAPARTAPVQTMTSLQARRFLRTTLERDWQTWSFSRLVRGSTIHAGPDPLPGSGDAETAIVATDATHEEPGLGGARFGTAVHGVFEQTDFAAWRNAAGVPEPARGIIERNLRAQGLAHGEAAMARACDVVGAFVGGALNASLPCGVRLCDVAPEHRRAEIEFHLTLAPTRSAELYALLHRHGYQQQRSSIAEQRLHGLLTGKIDLVFSHAGRFHVVDWKTNRCPPYDTAAMREEIANHDYDLQWLLYTLALHRWLRSRLPDYDYDRDVGEVYYLFVRGMAEGDGIHVDRPPRELVMQMDALFGAGGAA